MHPKQVEETDVVILGGGPAGLSAAWAAAKTGAKTVLLEKAPEIGSVVRTSGGTVIESLKGLGINENLYQPVSSVVLLGKTTHIEKTSEHPLYAILEVEPLYKHLGRRAEEAGAEIRVQTKGKLLQEAGKYVGVETSDRQIRAKITIDATGGWCENGDKAPRRALGLEIVAHTGCDKAVLIMDEVATYGWLFPEKSGKSRIGVGVIKPDRDTNLPAELQRITDELSRRLGIPSIDTTDPSYERHAGSYPIRGNYKKTPHQTRSPNSRRRRTRRKQPSRRRNQVRDNRRKNGRNRSRTIRHRDASGHPRLRAGIQTQIRIRIQTSASSKPTHQRVGRKRLGQSPKNDRKPET